MNRTFTRQLYTDFRMRFRKRPKTDLQRKSKSWRAALSSILSTVLLLFSSNIASANPAITRAEALTFAYIIDFSSGITCLSLTYNDCRINVDINGQPAGPMQATSLLIDRVNSGLQSRSLSNWQTGWVPTMQWKKGTMSNSDLYTPAGTMVVFKNGNTYVVAIAGTNSISEYGWYVEDFDVSQLVNWPNGSPTGKISAGTAEGLNLLLTMGGGQSAGTSTTLVDYLRAEATAAAGRNENIDVVVVGHSLGGTLSPVVATTLIDTQTSGMSLNWTIRNQDLVNLNLKAWDTANNATVSTIFFAGATPGDDNFASYANSLMQGTDRLISVWGKYDVVPHGWNELADIQNIYVPTGTNCNVPSSKEQCPNTSTTPASTDPSKVICPCLDTYTLISGAQIIAKNFFPRATPVGAGSQREEIDVGIGYSAQWATCPSSNAIVQAGTVKDLMMIEAIYQHDCSYPQVYPGTSGLADDLHDIREFYAQAN